jgi:hypothetical protein
MPNTLIQLKDAKIGDVIQLYVDTCSCCLMSMPSNESYIKKARCFNATILKKEKDGSVLIGWKEKEDGNKTTAWLNAKSDINKSDPVQWKKKFDYKRVIKPDMGTLNVSLISSRSEVSGFSFPVMLLCGIAGLSLASSSSNKHIKQSNEL